MKVLGIIVVILVILVVAVVGFAFMLPTEFSAQDSTLISCPPDSLYVRFATPRTWARWSAWSAQRDPSLVYTYEGPDSGVGATMSWTSKAMGIGRFQIVEAVPGRLVRYELRFMGSTTPIVGRVALEPKEGATLVVWHDTGSFGRHVLMRLFHPFMKKMMLQAYERSFTNLRSETQAGAEARPRP